MLLLIILILEYFLVKDYEYSIVIIYINKLGY